jgi:diguanylate cyclase (GGDEF)-like protein
MNTTSGLVVMVAGGFEEYHARLVAGIAPVLASNGLSLVVQRCGDPFHPALSEPLLRLIRRGRPSGVIATSCETAEQQEQLDALLEQSAVPTVRIASSRAGVSSVEGDNRAGMRALLGHLLDERGVRRPALVRGYQFHRDSQQREQVFREELAARDLPVDEELVLDGCFVYEHSHAAVAALLQHRRDFDAVVAANDIAALAALTALVEAGLRVPEDVLVTGFDNQQLARVNWPGLTTVDPDLEGQGAEAARLLVAELAGARPVGSRVVPSRLVVRGSTGLQALADAESSAIGFARAAQLQLAEQDAVTALNRALICCRTLEEVAAALSPGQLGRLGVERCFLVIHDDALSGAPEAETSMPCRLLLDYRHGTVTPSSDRGFADHELLPARLRGELADGALVFQPLTTAGRSWGYVLFEQRRGQVPLTDVLRVDLSRTLEAVFSTQALARHAEDLERLVAIRTRELEAEVATRRHAEEELQRSLMVDGLTRIGNRAALSRQVSAIWAEHPDGEQVALLMADVDLFKAYNDRYGHLMGDDALCAVADALARAARYPADLACRFGGEEFAVLLPDSGQPAALVVAHRFQRLLTQTAIRHGASTVASIVTASVGVAVVTLGDGSLPTDLIEAADKALYEAKAAGRNQVFLATPQPA